MLLRESENDLGKLEIAVVAAAAVAEWQGETAADVAEIELMDGPGVVFGGVERFIKGLSLP
jgi:hypothetical protein